MKNQLCASAIVQMAPSASLSAPALLEAELITARLLVRVLLESIIFILRCIHVSGSKNLSLDQASNPGSQWSGMQEQGGEHPAGGWKLGRKMGQAPR